MPLRYQLRMQKLPEWSIVLLFSNVTFRTEVPEGPGVVMLNPEYGERLGEEEDLKERNLSFHRRFL